MILGKLNSIVNDYSVSNSDCKTGSLASELVHLYQLILSHLSFCQKAVGFRLTTLAGMRI